MGREAQKIIIRCCPVTQARKGAQIPPSHPPHFPLAKWSSRLAASDSLLRLHRHSVYNELDWVWVIRMTDPSIVAPLNPYPHSSPVSAQTVPTRCIGGVSLCGTPCTTKDGGDLCWLERKLT
jgi:hypothetical protein